MKKSVSILMVASALLTASMVDAKKLPGELIMPGGKSWKGHVVGRDGEWIEFETLASTQPIRVGGSTIQELIFTLDIDKNELQRLIDNREYEQAVVMLESALGDYADYDDVRSNLTQYNGVLMDLYYKAGNYDKALNLASVVAKDDRYPDLQRKAIITEGMALLDAGRFDEADALFKQQGWTGDLANDAPAEDLYVTAKFLAAKKEYNKAIELVSKVIAFHSQDPDWMRPSELLCAEIYTHLDMLDSADEVIREISLLYKGTYEEEMAQKLKIRIDKLRTLKGDVREDGGDLFGK